MDRINGDDVPSHHKRRRKKTPLPSGEFSLSEWIVDQPDRCNGDPQFPVLVGSSSYSKRDNICIISFRFSWHSFIKWTSAGLPHHPHIIILTACLASLNSERMVLIISSHHCELLLESGETRSWTLCKRCKARHDPYLFVSTRNQTKGQLYDHFRSRDSSRDLYCG